MTPRHGMPAPPRPRVPTAPATSRARRGVPRPWWVAAAAVVAVTGALAAGCSRPEPPALGDVEGLVTLDGRPLPAALVLFTPAGRGRTAQGVTDALGRYRLRYLRDIPGANVDVHTVRISTATEEHGGRELLPPRYHADSQLTATVKAGRNTIDFALTTP